MIIERFRNGHLRPFQRFRDRGRLAPDGLEYVDSWVTDDFEICYQVMRTNDRALRDEWMSNSIDIVDFEVIPVITSAEARMRTH